MLSHNKGFLAELNYDDYLSRVLYFLQNHPDWVVGSREWYRNYMDYADRMNNPMYNPMYNSYGPRYVPKDEHGLIDQYKFIIPDDLSTLNNMTLGYLSLFQREFIINYPSNWIDTSDVIRWPFDPKVYPDPLSISDRYYAHMGGLRKSFSKRYYSDLYPSCENSPYIDGFDTLKYLHYLDGLFTGYTVHNDSKNSKKPEFYYPYADWNSKNMYFYPTGSIESVKNYSIYLVFEIVLDELQYTIKYGHAGPVDLDQRKANNDKRSKDHSDFLIHR